MRRALTQAALVAALLNPVAGHADDAEEQALRLADTSVDAAYVPTGERGLAGFVELAAGHAGRRGGDGARRASFDLRLERALMPDWRAFVANRLDMRDTSLGEADATVNTLKEAYVGWQASAGALLDLGRINQRNGVAAAYNPTDWFRAGAVRAVVSPDPASLRENRQGSIMLRGQRLWVGGAVSALYAPRLARSPNGAGLSPDVGATNGSERGVVALSTRVGDLAPQFLLYREAGRPLQHGLNLSALAGNATVVHLEWSGGRDRMPRASASTGPAATEPLDHTAWKNRLAAGLTWTSPQRLSLTCEYHYHGNGFDADGWNALRRGSPERYWRYRREALAMQEMPTRHALFLQARWQDAWLPNLDVVLMHQHDLTDRSHGTWLEARYHFGDREVAVQWQRNAGSPTSRFGAAGDSPGWQAVLRHYFQ